MPLAVVTGFLLHGARFGAPLGSRDDVGLADVTLLPVTDLVTVVTPIRP
jgi:hypothetical protein